MDPDQHENVARLLRMKESVCRVKSCSEPATAHRLCEEHHQAWLRFGDPKAVVCGEDVCPNRATARGLCSKHYRLLTLYGDVRDPVRLNDEERLRASTRVPSDPDRCWIWVGYVGPDGYGRVSRDGGTTTAAHRLAYELAYGRIGEGLQIHHRCETKACVRPDHLRAVTSEEHAHEHMLLKGTA